MDIHYGAGQHFATLMSDQEKLVLMYKWFVAAELIYFLPLWLCRVSGLAFYARVNPMPRFKLYPRRSFAFVTAVYIAQTPIIALQYPASSPMGSQSEGPLHGVDWCLHLDIEVGAYDRLRSTRSTSASQHCVLDPSKSLEKAGLAVCILLRNIVSPESPHVLKLIWFGFADYLF